MWFSGQGERISMEMLRTVGSDKFRCIGGDCEYTCCMDWGIIVDQDKVDIYKKIGLHSY